MMDFIIDVFIVLMLIAVFGIVAWAAFGFRDK